MGRLSLLALVLSLTIVLAAGCGGKSKPTATGTIGTTTSAETSTVSATSTTTTGTSSGLANIATAANCTQLEGLALGLAQAISGSGTTDLNKIKTLLQQFAARTPSDIRPDFELVASAYAKVVDALKGVNLKSGKAPSATVIAKLTQLGSELNTAALQKANAHITAWAQSHCGHA